MKKFLLISLVITSFCLSASAQTARRMQKETHLYSVRGADSLYLDRYSFADMPANTPCVVFMFGGGFVGGNRDGEGYIPYFQQLVNNGYTVISIDYRLGLRDIVAQRDVNVERFAGALANAVYIAVEDLFDATNYILSHASQWSVDPNTIVINGSSAGAVAVLQAEYEICNQSALARNLPAGFRYAGVISFAGAILALTPELTVSLTPAPIMLFHGDADNQVPYDKLTYEDYGFYGSRPIAAKLTEAGVPHYYYTAYNGGHELAGTPMKNNVGEIITFLHKWAKEKQPLIMDAVVKVADDNRNVKKDFTIADFIQSRIR